MSDYRQAGVNIAEGNRAVALMAAAGTFVLTFIKVRG